MSTPTPEMIEAGVNRLVELLPTIVADVYQTMSALEVAPAPEPEPVSTLPWKIPAPAERHADSDAMVDYLWNYGSDRAGNFNFMDTYPVYRASGGEALYAVSCGKGNLNGQRIPFRSDWNPPSHNDKQIIIFVGDEVIEFFEAAIDHTTGTITATRGDRFSVDLMQHSPSRGVGIPYHHMLILDEEIKAGVINHALSLRVGRPHCTEAWWPASKVEGTNGCAVDGIPEGARFACTFTQSRIDAWAAGLGELESFGRAVAKALQVYGFFITDNGSYYAAWDVQNPQSWSDDNPLKATALSSYSSIRDVLDELIQLGDFRLCPEIGPRIYR